jgi:uncharacterized protein YcbK (DUF882 family)
MGDLSAHFDRREVVCPHCGAGAVTPQLLAIIERLREVGGGKPLVVRSGFRCAPHNAAVGGAPNSRHLLGDACDLQGGTYTVEQAKAAGAVGIGYEGAYAVHVDWRPGPQVIFKD